MFLSPAECFILGRIAAAWPLRERQLSGSVISPSLFRVINQVFDDFGLERVGPPEKWWDRADCLPADVVWREMEKAKRTSEFMSTETGFPGVPTVAIGLSTSEKGTMFVERTDGRICGWRLEPPRTGLYLMLMRWLRPFVGPSPQLWAVLHEGPWPAIVEDWRTMTGVKLRYPHFPFADDTPGDVHAVLEAAANEAGSMEAYRLGRITGTVDYELEEQAALAGLRPLIFKCLKRYRRPADEAVIEAFERAKAIMVSDTAEEMARSDLHVASLYRMAKRELFDYEGEIYDLEVLTFAITLANERTQRASSYLYGMLHAAGA